MEHFVEKLFHIIIDGLKGLLLFYGQIFLAAGFLAVFIVIANWLKEKLHEDTYTIIKWVFFIILYLAVQSAYNDAVLSGKYDDYDDLTRYSR